MSNFIQTITTPFDPKSQIRFLQNRILALKKEMETSGDMGRAALVQMYTHIIVTLENTQGSETLLTNLVRVSSELQLLRTEYVKTVSVRTPKATGLLVKIRNAEKNLEKLIAEYYTTTEANS